jgi:hypothetical protein
MADKLLLEVEMLGGKSEDAVFALLNLANRLAESPTIHIKDRREWEEYECGDYRLRWRFTDGSYDEVCKRQADCQSPFIRQWAYFQ